MTTLIIFLLYVMAIIANELDRAQLKAEIRHLHERARKSRTAWTLLREKLRSEAAERPHPKQPKEVRDE